MSLRVCPIAPVHAPLERVWSFIAQPANFALWWGANTKGITPEGPAQPGQQIRATSKAFGVLWNVHLLVEHIDVEHHVLDVMTTLPLGIILFNHITCTELAPAVCQVSFG